VTPGFAAVRRGGLVRRWVWTAYGPGGPRRGRALSEVRALRAGWRAHRDLLGLPRLPTTGVPL
jgi:hypothetical protein